MIYPQIDFESMNVGDDIDLQGSDWEGIPRQQYNAAQEFARDNPLKQFQIDTVWRLNQSRGIEERVFILTRIR